MSNDDEPSEILLTLSEVAALLGRSEGTLRNDMIRNPKAVPPSIIIPGTRFRRFRKSDFQNWLAALPVDQPQVAPRRGRPRKSA